METLETVTEIGFSGVAFRRLYQFICILHCGRLSFWLGIPFLLGLGIHVMIRIFSKAS